MRCKQHCWYYKVVLLGCNLPALLILWSGIFLHCWYYEVVFTCTSDIMKWYLPALLILWSGIYLHFWYYEVVFTCTADIMKWYRWDFFSRFDLILFFESMRKHRFKIRTGSRENDLVSWELLTFCNQLVKKNTKKFIHAAGVDPGTGTRGALARSLQEKDPLLGK